MIPDPVCKVIKDCQEKMPKSCFPPDWDDLHSLWNLITEGGYKTIVEYGPGYSSIVLANALPEDGTMLSIESDPAFFTIIQSVMFSTFKESVLYGKKRGGAAIVFSPIETINSFMCRYSYVPKIGPDFVYIDGPALIHNVQVMTNIFEDTTIPAMIVVDGRKIQVKVIKAVFGPFYDVSTAGGPRFPQTIFTIRDKGNAYKVNR